MNTTQIETERRLQTGSIVTLEFPGTETVHMAEVVKREREPLGWGTTFEVEGKARRVWVYDADLEPAEEPAYYIVTDGR